MVKISSRKKLRNIIREEGTVVKEAARKKNQTALQPR